MIQIISMNEKKAHIVYNSKHYVISNNGFETLIFPGKTDGTISIYEEYGSAESIQDAIQNFKSCLHSWK